MIARGLARWLLGRLCPPNLREAFLGDLDEAYHAQAAGERRWRGDLWY